MSRVFFVVAVLGLALIGYVQFSENRGPSKGFLVTGMSPQIDVIREIVSARNWRVTCEGISGEMTALWVEPGFLADEDAEIAVREEISAVASTTSATMNANCSSDAPITSIDHPTANPPLVFGDEQALQPYLELARSCGYEEAIISTVAEIDQANAPPELPSDWMALYAGQGSADRYGPGICMVKMQERIQS